MSLFRRIRPLLLPVTRRARGGPAHATSRQIATTLICALGLVSLASSARARDVCLTSSFGEQLVFRNVPSLRPGRSVNLSGIYLNTVTTIISVPFEGSAMMSGDGKTVRIGIFVHEMGAPPLHNFTFEWTAADLTFAGSGYYDSNGDYLADGPVSFGAFPSCKFIAVY